MDVRFASQIAESWMAAWNRHDLEAILRHYDEEAELVSPMVVARLRLADGRLRGRAALGDYFAQGLAKAPGLHFELVSVAAGVNGLGMVYQRETGATVIEALTVADRLIRYAVVHYDRDVASGA